MGIRERIDQNLSERNKKIRKNIDDMLSGTIDIKEYETQHMNELIAKQAQLDDIAPVKQEERTWFKGGAFSDGYQFGDVTKTILGTSIDLKQDIIAGAGGIAEKTIDAGAYLLGGGAKLIGQDNFAKTMENFVKKDLINEEEIATKVVNAQVTGWINNLINGNSVKGSDSRAFEKNSLLGEKSDSLVQSGGQLLGTIGLQAVGVPWFVTTGVTSFGSGTEQAFQNDATYGEAGVYGLISAGAEILTEKISGGISFGGKTLDAGLKDVLFKNISNNTIKILGKLGFDAAGEGFEEVLTEVIQNVGQKLTYEDEKTWGQILASEEAMDAYLESFIGGAVLGGVANTSNAVSSIKNGTDYNGDIAPVDNTAQIEGLQQAIEAKQEEYNKTQDVREKQIIQEEIENLIEEYNEATNAQTITDESELRKQNFTYQAQETDSDIKKAVYESASQVMNNTEKSHKFADVVAKIAEEKGTTYKFTNNEQLKELGYAKENLTVNGLVNENGEVLINIDSAKALNTIVGHETTHLLEGTKEYDALKQVALEYAKSKGDYDLKMAQLHSLYKDTNANIENELVSDIVGDYLFTDEAFVKELSVKQPTLFEKIKNFISDLVVKFKGTDQEKQLRQLQRSFEKAYKAQGTQTNTNTKYSLSEDTQGRKLSEGQKEYFKGVKTVDENGHLKPFYHGTQRADRVGTLFDPDRATSGPMAYFTDSQEIAQNYSENKSDTSLSREYDTEYDLFKADGKDLDSYWNSLSRSKQIEITEKANNVGFDDDFENIVYGENASENSFGDQFKWRLKNEYKGNALKSLYGIWIEDGNLMDSDIAKFKEILELSGVENVNYLDPYKTDSKVYEVYLALRNPLNTSEIPENIVTQLIEASKTATIGEQYSADMWDKSNISPEQWISKFESDIEEGTAHSWTVIPDWVTNVLKQNGYDGIIDTGGKGGGVSHQVAIPFYSEQVKDVNNQNPTDNPNIDMSLSAQNQEVAPTGQWNVYGEDLKLQVEEVIAPLQETIESLAEQVKLMQENIAPTSQDIVEQQGQEAFDNITENDAPIDVDNRSFEDVVDEVMWNEGFEGTTETKVESPFDNRDIDAVGKRNIKAYQFENPEVRPYFQTEAQNMLWDLDNTIKGERSFNDQLYYDSNGEQGFFGTTRQTTDAIAYLKDNYGYSYAQIRKGLNDIIEDNGKENNAAAKRIEFMLDERLREGYTTSDGIPIPPNEEYINFLKDKQITQYNKEAFEALTDNDIPILPEEQGLTTEPQTLQVDESIAPVENEAQNQNTGLSDTSTETQEQEEVAKILSEAPTQENKKQRLWAKIRAGVFDKGSVFEDLSIKSKNRELMAKWDNTLLAEAVAQDVMLNGTREIDAQNKSNNIISKSLVDIKAEVENAGKVQEFSEYLYHKHNVDRMNLESKAQARMAELLDTTLRKYEVEDIEKLSRKRLSKEADRQGNLFAPEEGEISKEELIEAAKEYVSLSKVKNKPVFGDSVTSDVSQEMVNEYEMDNPEFIDWAKDVYDYNKANLNHLVTNGVISQETADQFAEMYPNYVPIGRAKHLGNAINVPLDTNRTTVNTPIKRATGGNSDILPLFDTMARRTIQTYKAAAKNDFGVELRKVLKSKGNNQVTNVDEVLDNVDNQDNLLQEGINGQSPTFTVFENGEKVTYEITEDIYNALKPVSESSILSTTFKPFNKISNFHRGVLTEYNPVFMLTNSIKDAQDILLNSQHAAKTYSKLPESYAQIIKKGYWYQEYIANGGQQNSYFDSQEGNFDTERKGIGKVLDTFPLKQISQLNNVIELAPRLAEYIASRESGRSKKVSMLDAARVTTNFKAGGDITKWANRNGATFLNASIQGAMQQVRNVREANMNGLKGYANLASKFALAGIPAMILNSLLWDDDEEYQELSDYVKQSYWIVGKYGDGNFIRIPKGRMITVVQEGLNQMKNLVTGNDEADLGQFLEIMVTNIAPNNPIENNVLAPIIQAATNKTWYGGDLVPTRLQDVPATEQYDESIDKLSIGIGQATGISPYKINYVLDQYSGGIGDVFLPMMTEQAEGGDDNIGSKLIAPLTSKFSVDSTMKNQSVSDLYTLSEELTTKANSSKATDTDIIQNKYLNAIKSEMNELYKEKRELQNSDLPDSEKYNQVRDIQKQINSMAKEAINNYENVEKTSNYASIGDKEYYNKNGTWTKVNKEEATELNSMNMTTAQKDTYFNLKTKISTIENSETENKKSEIATAVMNTNLSDEQKAYIYGKNYSSDETLNMVVNGGIDFNEYLKYAAQTITADKDENGKTVSGSKKAKVISAINSLNLDIPQKAMLIRKEYSSFREYNNDIVSYVSSLDVDYQTKVEILKELDMTVSSDGTVSWK